MKKILLLIDPNQSSRVNLSTFLTTLGYKVVQADSFKGGMDFLNNSFINMVVISDVVPEKDEAAKKIQSNFGLRSVLVVAASKITKAEATQTMGYLTTFSVPYVGQEIKAFFENQFKIFQGKEEKHTETGAALELSDSEFCAAFIDDFMKNPVSRFDLYYKLNDRRYIKVTRGGEEVNQDLFYRLKANNIDRIYLKKDDYKKYISLNIEKISLSKEDTPEKREEQMGFLVSTSNLILQNVYIEGVDKDLFMMGKQVTDTALEIIGDNDYMYQLLYALNQTNEDLYRHNLGMSIYSVLIAKALGWTSPTTHFKLSISSLYADISLRQMDPKLVAKPKMLYSHIEMREYQQHPLSSAEIVRNIGGIQEDMYQIILNHHENVDGTGYPSRLSKTAIHPLSKVIRVTDEFCSLVLKSKDNTNVLSPKDAINHMEKYGVKKYDEEVMKALKHIFSSKFFTEQPAGVVKRPA